MKVGDLVKYTGDGMLKHLGLVLKVEFAEPATNNVRVKWNTQRTKNLWHHVNDLEVISESR